MPSGGIRIHNPRRRVAADIRLRPRGHWDRHNIKMDIQEIGWMGVDSNNVGQVGTSGVMLSTWK